MHARLPVSGIAPVPADNRHVGFGCAHGARLRGRPCCSYCRLLPNIKRKIHLRDHSSALTMANGVQFDNNLWIYENTGKKSAAKSAAGGVQSNGMVVFRVEEFSTPVDVKVADIELCKRYASYHLKTALAAAARRFVTGECAGLSQARAREVTRPRSYDPAKAVDAHAPNDVIARAPALATEPEVAAAAAAALAGAGNQPLPQPAQHQVGAQGSRRRAC